MPEERVVYKFGGSCFETEEDYRKTAEFLVQDAEDADGPVCVVVSAQKGRTNRLIEEAEDIFTSPWSMVDYVAEDGEFASAGRLVRALLEAGESAEAVTPWDMQLTAQGSNPFACEMVGIQDDSFKDSESRFLVIPGYVGVHESREFVGWKYLDRDKGKSGSRPALVALGRGASDLIAVEVARCMEAKLKLMKSASSVYAVSPDFVESPTRIEHMTFDQALRVLEYIRQKEQFIMADAVRYAQKHNVPLEFRSTNNGQDATYIGPGNPTQFSALPVKENVSRVHAEVYPMQLASFYAALYRNNIPFNDGGSESVDGKMRVHIFLENGDVPNALRAAEQLVRKVHVTEGALLTLIDTSLDPEGNHFMRVHKALNGILPLHTASSGIILHVFVSPSDTSRAVNSLAKEFDLV